MNRLLPIEGLRAYLAIWVVLTHIDFFASAALAGPVPAASWQAVARLFDSGPFAVQVFMIISGYVITLLLDKRRESYAPFITRRFFRLYPVYIILLLASIAAEPWRWSTFVASRQYMDAPSINYFVFLSHATWNNWWPSVGLHLVMLQGLPHADWLNPGTVYSFIIAGWSISVEWEFYLVIPLIFFLLKSPSALHRIAVWAVALGIFLLGRHFDYLTPTFFYFMPFFFLGIASYFIYQMLPATPPNTAFPGALVLALFAYISLGRDSTFVPLLIWIPFFGLLCEPADSLSARLLVIFNNRAVQLLGAFSYGIYICHEFVILLVQNVLLMAAPGLGATSYYWALLVLVLPGTFALAAALHYLVERPGMRLGRHLADRMSGHPAEGAMPEKS